MLLQESLVYGAKEFEEVCGAHALSKIFAYFHQARLLKNKTLHKCKFGSVCEEKAKKSSDEHVFGT